MYHPCTLYCVVLPLPPPPPPLQEGAPLLAVYCTFRAVVPDTLLESLVVDLQGVLQVGFQG